MRPLMFLLVLTAAGMVLPAVAADESPVTYYVQLIRGNDNDKAPATGSKPVGPKLTKALRPVFPWKSYWEMTRKEVTVVPGKSVRVNLNEERDVEIDLTDPAKRKVTVFQDGKPVTRNSRSSGEAMTIIGGDRDAKSVWFIVVRRDKPEE